MFKVKLRLKVLKDFFLGLDLMTAVKGNRPGTAEWEARTLPLLSLLYAIFESLLVFREESYQCVLVSGSRRANLLHFSEGSFEGSFQKCHDI